MTDIATLSIAVDSTPVNKAKTAMDSMSDSGDKLEGIINSLVAAWASWEISKHIVEITSLSARYDTMGIVMGVAGNNAGYTRAEMAGLQQELMKTGISALQSRDALTNLSTANIDLSNATRLARAAQDVAVVGNMNSSEALGTLIHGIKSGQTETLRTMGINVQFEDGYKKLAATLGKTSQELTTQEKTQSRANQVLAEAARYAGIYEASMGTAGKQAKTLERYIENLEVSMGSVFQPAYSTAVGIVSESIKTLSGEFEQLQKSGDIAVYSVKIKDSLSTVWSAISTTTGFMVDHRGAIITLAGAYAGFKTADFVQSVYASSVSLLNEAKSRQAAILAAYNHKTAVTQEALAMVGHTMATNEDAIAQIAMAQRMVVYNELALSNAAATGSMTAAEIATARAANATAAAKLEEAAAIQASNSAGEAASVAMGGLTGGITILITLLGAAAAAWWMFKDSTSKQGQDAIRAADDRIAALNRETEAQKRYWEARSMGLDPGSAKAATWVADDEAEVRALTKAYGVLQGVEENYIKFSANSGKSQAQARKEIEDMRASIKNGGTHGDSDIAKALIEENVILEKRAQLVQKLNTAHSGSEAMEKDAMARAEAARKYGAQEENAIEVKTESYTQYGREIEHLKEQLASLTLSEREAFEMRLRSMDNGAIGDVSKGMDLYDQIEHIKNQNELLRMGIEDRERLMQKDAQIRGTNVNAKNNFMFQELDAATRIEDENEKLGASMKMLNELYASGNVSERQYRDRMIDLSKQAHVMTDMFGDLRDTINDWSRSSTDAFVEFCFTAKNTFGDLVTSMLEDLARLAVQKSVMDPLFSYAATGISEWLGSGSGTDLGSGSILSDGGDSVNVTGSSWYNSPDASVATASPVQINAININAATGKATTDMSGQSAAQLSKAITGAVQAEIVKQKRTGGLLA